MTQDQSTPQPDLEVPLRDDVRMAFQRIPAGEFRMGERGQQSAAEPIHTVRITTPFYLGTYPVRQCEFAVWTEQAGISHSNYFSDRPDHPAESIELG